MSLKDCLSACGPTLSQGVCVWGEGGVACGLERFVEGDDPAEAHYLLAKCHLRQVEIKMEGSPGPLQSPRLGTKESAGWFLLRLLLPGSTPSIFHIRTLVIRLRLVCHLIST